MSSPGTLGRTGADDFLLTVLLFVSPPEDQRPSANALRNELLASFERVNKMCLQLTISESELDSIGVALIAFADEQVMNCGWSQADVWMQNTLQGQIYDRRDFGSYFFDCLDALPREHVVAREVFFYCLSLGFQGRYHDDPGGRAALIDQEFTTLRSLDAVIESASVRRLSPTAYNVEIDFNKRERRRVWPWILGTGVGLVALYLLGHVWLRWAAEQVPLPGVGT